MSFFHFYVRCPLVSYEPYCSCIFSSPNVAFLFRMNLKFTAVLMNL